MHNIENDFFFLTENKLVMCRWEFTDAQKIYVNIFEVGEQEFAQQKTKRT